MNNRSTDDDDPPARNTHDAVALSHWMNQVTALASAARAAPPAALQGDAARTLSSPSGNWRAPVCRPPRERQRPVCHHPDGPIAKSWQEPDTRRARLTRDHVEAIADNADSVEFRSIAKAFDAFEIPKKFLTQMRKDVKNAYQCFEKGESQSEFVAMEYKEKIFIFRIIKRPK
jgi:hypothetical protein